MNEDVFLTGGSGFVGAAIHALARRTSISMRAPTHREADILRPETLEASMRGASTVIHAAGATHLFDPTPASEAALWQTNVDGTRNVVRAARRVGARHVILVSSVAVYSPEGAYATSKVQAEAAAIEEAGTLLPLTILRLATVYGEGDRGNVLRLIRFIDRRRFVWIGRGENRKSLIDRDEAAAAILLATKSIPTGREVQQKTEAGRREQNPEMYEHPIAALGADHRPCTAGDDCHTAGNPVDAVHEIETVRQPHDPEDRQDPACCTERQRSRLRQREMIEPAVGEPRHDRCEELHRETRHRRHPMDIGDEADDADQERRGHVRKDRRELREIGDDHSTENDEDDGDPPSARRRGGVRAAAPGMIENVPAHRPVTNQQRQHRRRGGEAHAREEKRMHARFRRASLVHRISARDRYATLVLTSNRLINSRRLVDASRRIVA